MFGSIISFMYSSFFCRSLRELAYMYNIIATVISQFMIQGGDIVNFNGTSGESIYGPYFNDENFTLKHSTAGLLSMVNEGKSNTNSSQFIITVQPSMHLDNTNVVFGKVVRGMGVVLEINKMQTENDTPLRVRLSLKIIASWICNNRLSL